MGGNPVYIYVYYNTCKSCEHVDTGTYVEMYHINTYIHIHVNIYIYIYTYIYYTYIYIHIRHIYIYHLYVIVSDTLINDFSRILKVTTIS